MSRPQARSARAASPRPAASSDSPRGGDLPRRTAQQYRAGALLQNGLPRAPRCSLAHGGAGVAYFLTRYAKLTGDSRALTAAGGWSTWAERDLRRTGAFVVRSSRVFLNGPHPPLPSSLYFGEAGVWCIAALVGDERRDAEAVGRALGRFDAIAEACSEDALDATFGAASLLLGAAVLVEELSHPPAGLITAGERLAARLSAAIEQHGQPGTEPIAWLGAAHGWCGIAHALLRWCQATRAKPGSAVTALLDALADLRQPSGLWPRREGSSEVWAGWCHGSAGWVQLWTLAWELSRDDDSLALAEHAAAHVVADEHENAGLCCGLAGNAYALLALHRATGELGWLAHARRIAAKAQRAPVGDDFPEHSLWRGDLGVALLAIELEQPTRAAMPLYRALG